MPSHVATGKANIPGHSSGWLTTHIKQLSPASYGQSKSLLGFQLKQIIMNMNKDLANKKSVAYCYW